MGSSSDRLPSFKGPRDLSLSSRGTNKPNVAASQAASQSRPRRVFTPNIPPKRDRNAVTSNANSSASSTASQNTPGSSRGRAPRGRGGAARGGARSMKHKGELVQSESIFSDGVGDPTEAKRTAASQYRSGYGGRYKSATEGGSSRMSSMNRATLDNLIKQEDEESNRKIFGDENVLPDQEDVNTDNPDIPVVLPLSSYVPEYFMGPTFLEPSLATYPPTEVEKPALSTNDESQLIPLSQIKKEKIDESEPQTFAIKQEKCDSDTTKNLKGLSSKFLTTMQLDSTSFASTYRSAPPDGTLVYFQFPDELPILESNVGDALVDQPSTGKSASTLVHDIDELPEGFIGRLQILSSGRTRFIIGENSFDVDAGRPVGFRQELYAVDMDNTTLTNLGSVSKKFVLTPDVECLLQDIL